VVVQVEQVLQLIQLIGMKPCPFLYIEQYHCLVSSSVLELGVNKRKTSFQDQHVGFHFALTSILVDGYHRSVNNRCG
jgi:hypothetical protein